jgi:hypothetical protein
MPNLKNNCKYSNSFCIIEDSLVRVYENNSEQYYPIQDLKKGTCIIEDNKSAFVKCLIKTKYSGVIYKRKNNDNNNNNIVIGFTPYHPIFINNEWTFPINSNLFESKNVSNINVYNLFLEGQGYENIHQIELYGGIIACTLNHGKIGPIIGHNYFGTNKVQLDFEKHPDWENGFIDIKQYKLIRDKNTNEVIGINYNLNRTNSL